MPGKLRYEIDLTAPMPLPPAGASSVRTVARTDHAALARLMLDAYVGTIDYDDEDLDDAMTEVGAFLQDGDSLLDRSYVAEDAGVIASAVLVSRVEGAPFIGYVMTLPSHKRHGLARLLVAHAMRQLSEDGNDRATFYITDGNTPSEELFRSLGAVRTGS